MEQLNTINSMNNEEILNLLIDINKYNYYDINRDKCIDELKTEILSRMK